MKKNVAGQKIGAQMVSATDGSAFTGSVTVYVTGDAGSQGAGSVGAGACTHEGNGYHTYAPADTETNFDLVAFTFVGTGAVPATVQIYTSFPQTADVVKGIYTDGAVWIDTVNGAAGTASYVNGTQNNPCSTLASALTVATAVGLRRFVIRNGSSITLASGYTGWVFVGKGYATIALGGQALTSVQIDGCIVSGTATTGLLSLENCSLLTCTLPANTAMEHCTFVGPITMGAAGDYYVFDSEAANIGGSPVTFDFGAGLGNSTLQLRKWTGTLSLANMGQSGTDSATVAGEGRLEIAASSQNSTVRIAGNLTVADSGTAMTFIEGGNVRNTAGVNTPAVLNVTTTSGKVTPIDVDGLTHASAMEALLAVLLGVAAPSGATVAFKKQNGLTTKVTITYGATDGERTGSTVI